MALQIKTFSNVTGGNAFFKAIGHPLVGDPTYGEARWRAAPSHQRRRLREFPRPALHAWRLRFAHPSTGAPTEVIAPVPRDLSTLWQEIGGDDRDWPEAGV